MKKILIVIRALSPGGAEKSLVSFLNTLDETWLNERNIQIDLMLTTKGGFFDNQIPSYINVIDCPIDYAAYCNPLQQAKKDGTLKLSTVLRKVYSGIVKKVGKKNTGLSDGELQWKYVGRTLSALKKRYDVAIAYFHDASAYYVIDKVEANKKVIWIHNEYEKLGFNDDFQREFYKAADNIVTISKRCVESFAKHFPDMSDKVLMIENITSGKLISNLANDGIPTEYKNQNAVKILSVGRLVEQKGYDLGIEAAKILQGENIDFHWYIIGAGELEDELRNLTSRYSLSDRISFLGLKSNPYPYIANCDVFFQPSRYEGRSIALDEAMILERPIVATKYPTVFDSINDGYNGVLCDLKPEQIASALRRVLESGELRLSLTNNLKNEEHGNESEIEKYCRLLES